jgi:hypothetical protein
MGFALLNPSCVLPVSGSAAAEATADEPLARLLAWVERKWPSGRREFEIR